MSAWPGWLTVCFLRVSLTPCGTGSFQFPGVLRIEKCLVLKGIIRDSDAPPLMVMPSRQLPVSHAHDIQDALNQLLASARAKDKRRSSAGVPIPFWAGEKQKQKTMALVDEATRSARNRHLCLAKPAQKDARGFGSSCLVPFVGKCSVLSQDIRLT